MTIGALAVGVKLVPPRPYWFRMAAFAGAAAAYAALAVPLLASRP